MIKKTILTILILLVTQFSFAQSTPAGTSNLRRNVATIMFAGLAGAVLGLSTLSFYGEPQEHIGNIWLGLGVGAIAGSAYVLSKNSSPTYESQIWPTNPHQVRPKTQQLFAYSWEF